MRGFRPSRRTVAVAAMALLGLGPMLLAGQPAWAVLSITGASLAALVLLIGTHNKALRLIEADFVVVAALLWTLVQLAPVPDSLVVDSVLRGRALAGVHGLAPLTFDPGATRERAVVCVIVVAAYGAGRLAARIAGRRLLLYVFAASCAGMAMVAFGHELTNAHRVFGLYEPLDANPSLMSPILNSNQLGGFLAFGAVLWLGLGFSARERPEALGDAAMGTLCAIGALGTGSRGAALGLALGFAFALAVLIQRGRGKRRLRSRQLLVAVGVIGLVVSLFAVTGLARLATDITDGDYSKLDLIGEGAQMSLARPLVGVGRGAFEPAFASKGTSSLRFTHPENIVVQWGAEWGWAFTLLAFGVWIRFLWRAARSERIYVAIGAAAAASFVLHDLFDFALEMPGILVVFMAALGVLAPSSGARSLRPRWQLAVAALLVGVGGWLGVGVPALRPEAVAAQARVADKAALQELTSVAIAAHPLSPAVTLVLASRMAELEDPRALRWLNRTMELAPAWSSPHEIAARLLARRGAYSQALLEARVATRLRPQSAREVLCWLAPRAELSILVGSSRANSRDADDDAAAHHVGEQLAECMDADRAHAFDDALIEDGSAPGALIRRARRRFRAGDHAGALADLRLVPERLRNTEVLLLWARALGERDGPVQALEFFDERVAGRSDANEARLLAARAELAARADDEEALEESLGLLRGLGAGDSERIAWSWGVAGKCYRLMGRSGAAMEAYQRAHNLDPEENRYLWALVGLMRSEGVRGHAAYLRILCERGQNRACQRENASP